MKHISFERQLSTLNFDILFGPILDFISWKMHKICSKVYYQGHRWLACPPGYIIL